MNRVLYLVLIGIAVNSLEFLKDVSKSNSNLCLTMALKVFLTDPPIVIIYDKILEDVGDHLLRNIRDKSIIVNSNLTNESSTSFVILSKNITQSKNTINELKAMKTWTARAKLLLYFDEKITRKSLESLFYFLNNKTIYNAIIAVKTNQSIVKFHTAFPMNIENHCGKNIEVKTQVCVHSNNFTLDHHYLSNISDCQWNMITMFAPPYIMADTLSQEPGISVEFTRLIIEATKLNVIIAKPQSKYIQDMNGEDKYPNVRADLTGLPNLAFISPALHNFRFLKYFEVILYYFDDSFVWIISAAKPFARWKNIVYIFPPMVWLTVVLVFIAMPICWWILAKFGYDRSRPKMMINCILDVLQIHLGIPVHYNPNSKVLRNLLLMWSVYGLTMSAISQAELFSLMASQTYEKQISTLEDINRVNLPVYLQPFVLEWTVDLEIRNLHINEPRALLFDVYDTMKLGHRATAASTLLSSFIAKTNINPATGRPKFFRSQQRLTSGFTTLIMQKGHPLVEHFNMWTLRCHAAGFSKKILQDAIEMKSKSVTIRHGKSLSIDHLIAPFIILAIGLLMSCVVFIWEYVQVTGFRCNLNVLKVKL